MYESKLTIKETQKAIKILKDTFEEKLAKTFNLDRVSAPIILKTKLGFNDDLGIENSALKFNINSLGYSVEIVQSLAKWKRIALKKYGYNVKEGIYADMNAIRPLDITDEKHSIYVDQWDWEFIIEKDNRNDFFLEEVVKKIVKAIKESKDVVKKHYNNLHDEICDNVFFIDAEELFNLYPNHSSKERERLIVEKYKTVFIKKIGKKFKNGMIHDMRAFDYDDWNLNGDLLFWSNVLKDAIEISSMGIRVDDKSLLSQMQENKKISNYHNMILKNELPLTIGGGIGQSRLCMLLLEKMHIAEVQASIWSSKDDKFFKDNNIKYL